MHMAEREQARPSRRTFAKQALAVGAATVAARTLPTPLHAQGTTAVPGFVGKDSLKAHAAAHGLFAGAAVNLHLLDTNPAYKQTLIEQCNIVVAENAMKWGPMRPTPDTFQFDEADRLVAFAEQHGMAIRGHNLCWHEQLPGWFEATVTKSNAEEFLVKHIQTVAGRYRGKIRAWDVVNEAIKPEDGQPDGFRNGPWYKLLGPRFIEIAFRTARAADPHALLTYNDYDIETDRPQDVVKRAAVLQLIEHMKQTGMPIDAVGVQSHLSTGSAAQIGAGLDTFVSRVQALGLKVFVTELDVNDDSLGDGTSPDEGLRARQQAVAEVYGRYVGSMLKHPAVTDVLTWGVANGASWLNAPGKGGAKFRPLHPDRKEVCLPFTDAYAPEPAFFALRTAYDSRTS